MRNPDGFLIWFCELRNLANQVKFPLDDDGENYREYYDDGDSPADCLDNEIMCADFDDDDENVIH